MQHTHVRSPLTSRQASLSKLNDDFESAKAALKSSTRATTSAAAVISSRAEYADASLAYLKVEAKCVEFLRKRVAAAKVTAAKLQFEISRYEELGTCQLVG